MSTVRIKAKQTIKLADPDPSKPQIVFEEGKISTIPEYMLAKVKEMKIGTIVKGKSDEEKARDTEEKASEAAAGFAQEAKDSAVAAATSLQETTGFADDAKDPEGVALAIAAATEAVDAANEAAERAAESSEKNDAKGAAKAADDAAEASRVAAEHAEAAKQAADK